MATFKRFEEIESWKRARELTNKVYQVSKQGDFAKDFTLKDQVRRACISIMSNIGEGYDRSGTKEFVQFLQLQRVRLGKLDANSILPSIRGISTKMSLPNLDAQLWKRSV